MQRTVSARMTLELGGAADLILSVAASLPATPVSETLTLEIDGREYDPAELFDRHGTRLHTLTAGPGRMNVSYDAVVQGRTAAPAVDPFDAVLYTRPSRYC